MWNPMYIDYVLVKCTKRKKKPISLYPFTTNPPDVTPYAFRRPETFICRIRDSVVGARLMENVVITCILYIIFFNQKCYI